MMENSMFSSRKVIAMVGGFGLVGILVVAVIHRHDQEDPMPFDSARWKNPPDYSGDDARRKMITDLQDRYFLQDMTKDKIIELLGEPDKKNRISNDDFSYYLGPEKGFVGMDSEWLVLRFNEDKVSKHFINTD